VSWIVWELIVVTTAKMELIVVTTAKIPNEIDSAPSLFLIMERKFITNRYYRVFSFNIEV